jgi:hypothetical protein
MDYEIEGELTLVVPVVLEDISSRINSNISYKNNFFKCTSSMILCRVCLTK